MNKFDPNKFKVVFFSFGKYTYPNLGVGYLISNLKKHGFNCDFKYLECQEGIDTVFNKIAELKPDLVGITSTSVHFNIIKALSKKLRNDLNPIMLFGGAHISSVPKTLPEEIDVGFIGESENTIVDIFNLIKKDELNSASLKKIDGIVFYDDDDKLIINEKRRYVKDLDSYPLPDRGVFSDDYWQEGVTSLLTSRGCPFHCSFCQVSEEWRICRYHSAERVVQEIKELSKTYKIHTFGIIDDLFIANKKRIKEIIELLRKENLLGKVRFAVNGRANLMSEEIIDLLKEMGTAEIAMGLESMSPKILSILKDKATVEDNKRAVDLIYKGGLKTGGLYMIGTPTETLEDLKMTYVFVKENRHKFGGMQVCITTPLPKTKLWDLCVEKRLIDPDYNHFRWDKLNIAAENIESNLYVGDLPQEYFKKVLYKFRKLFFEYKLENQKNPIDIVKVKRNLLKLTNRRELKLLPGKIKRRYFGEYVKLFEYEFEIDSTNPFQYGVPELPSIREGDNDYYVLKGKNKFSMSGFFNTISVTYKGNGLEKYNVGNLIIGRQKFGFKNTDGQFKTLTFDLKGSSTKVDKNVFVNIKNNDSIILHKIATDYAKMYVNFIKAGENDNDQVKLGSYSSEKWSNNKIFWTDGYLKALLKPSKKEKKIVLEFQSGHKTNKDDQIKIEMMLFNKKDGNEFFNKTFSVPQATWCKEEFNLPALDNIDEIELILRTDTFSPNELGMSADPRILGVAVKQLSLI